MQDRATFLSDGLTPVDSSSLTKPEDTTCAICTDPFTNAAELPCTRRFCRTCIEQWLSLADKNSCPSCRRQLFVLSSAEPAVPAAPDLARLVYQAVHNAGLSTLQPMEIEWFGIPRPSSSAMARATPAAAQYLIYSLDSAQAHEAGPATLDVRVVAAHVVALGNIIPALAALRGQAYDARQRADWRILLANLHALLVHMDGRCFDALVMPRLLRDALEQLMGRLPAPENPIGFLDATAPVSMDLDTLIVYVTHVCLLNRADQERRGMQGPPHRRERNSGRRSGRCAVM